MADDSGNGNGNGHVAVAPERRARVVVRAGGDEPYFRPDSMYAQMWAFRASYMGLPRMILVEGAHPLVYTGIIGHSAYQGQAFAGRIMRTGKMFRTLAYAPRSTADSLLEVVHEMHGRVSGTLKSEDGGPRYPKGSPFRATDPDLLLWVLHGVFESFELGFHKFVRNLTPEERERHWQDWRLAGRLFGIPDDEIPKTRADVDAYAREMYETDRTWVTEAARTKSVGYMIEGRDPDTGERTMPWYAAPGWQMLKSFTLTTLPERVRKGYRLERAPARAALIRGSAAGSRVMTPRMDRWSRGRLTRWPEAYGKAKGAAWTEVRIEPRSDGTRVIQDV
jgi:uncharacterized protein (DUF2236 family)